MFASYVNLVLQAAKGSSTTFLVCLVVSAVYELQIKRILTIRFSTQLK